MTAVRSANDVWLQDSNVFCACPSSSIACSSVGSSKVATTWLSYGFTVWYAMVLLPFSSRRRLATALEWCLRAAALLTRVGRVADLAFKPLTADAAQAGGKEPISRPIPLPPPLAVSC